MTLIYFSILGWTDMITYTVWFRENFCDHEDHEHRHTAGIESVSIYEHFTKPLDGIQKHNTKTRF